MSSCFLVSLTKYLKLATHKNVQDNKEGSKLNDLQAIDLWWKLQNNSIYFQETLALFSFYYKCE